MISSGKVKSPVCPLSLHNCQFIEMMIWLCWTVSAECQKNLPIRRIVCHFLKDSIERMKIENHHQEGIEEEAHRWHDKWVLFSLKLTLYLQSGSVSQGISTLKPSLSRQHLTARCSRMWAFPVRLIMAVNIWSLARGLDEASNTGKWSLSLSVMKTTQTSSLLSTISVRREKELSALGLSF